MERLLYVNYSFDKTIWIEMEFYEDCNDKALSSLVGF